jgi:hypothetical protein
MNPASNPRRNGAEPGAEAELATLCGGSPDPAEAYPLLIEPWQEEWDTESELDAQIFAGLLRLAP